jgi:hypothetical protein
MVRPFSYASIGLIVDDAYPLHEPAFSTLLAV